MHYIPVQTGDHIVTVSRKILWHHFQSQHFLLVLLPTPIFKLVNNWIKLRNLPFSMSYFIANAYSEISCITLVVLHRSVEVNDKHTTHMSAIWYHNSTTTYPRIEGKPWLLNDESVPWGQHLRPLCARSDVHPSVLQHTKHYTGDGLSVSTQQNKYPLHSER